MQRNSHAKTLVITLAISALIIIGQKAFSTLFATTFMVLFLAPIVIFYRALTSGKKYKLLMANYNKSYSMEDALVLTEFLAKKKYQAGIDHHFFREVREFYASVSEQDWATEEMIDNVEKAMLVYNVKLEHKMDVDLDETLIETN